MKGWDDIFSGLGRSLGKLWKGLGNIAGGIWGGIKWLGGKLGINASKVFDWLWQGVTYLWRFNWNISDEAIDEQLQADLESLAGMLGGAFGASVGWGVCGGIGSAVLMKIDPAMAMSVTAELGEEAKEELLQVWSQVGFRVIDIIAENAFKQVYKGARRLIKNRKWVQRIFGEKTEEIMESWGKPGGEVISLAKWKQDRIDEIPNRYIRNFVDEFFEEFGDSCHEALMVIAGGIDSYQALQSTSIQEQVLGENKVMDIIPNKEDGQIFRLYGRENLVRQEATSFLANYQLLYGKDIGQYIGEPAPQYQMKKIHTISAVILWYSKVTQPFRIKGQNFKQSTLTIPDLKKTGITWRGLQKAAGGIQGFVSGPSKFWCKLSCGSSTLLWAETERVAEDIVRDLMEFSASDIIANSSGTQKKTERQNENNRNYKKKIRIYPYQVTFFRTGADRNGRVRLYDSRNEKVSRRSLTLPLWQNLSDPQYDEAIDEFLNDAFADMPQANL